MAVQVAVQNAIQLMNLMKIEFQIQTMEGEIRKIHSQKKVPSKIIRGPDVLQENETLSKSNYSRDATQLVMDRLILTILHLCKAFLVLE